MPPPWTPILADMLESTTPETLPTATKLDTSASVGVVVLNLASNTSADSRTVELVPAKPCVIGRSSRSKNIVPASDNLLFDCPVVSRFHAELRYSPWQAPDQQVTITDTASLHGTMVNGQRLVPYNEFALKMGDVIKFGERVSRGEDTHDGICLTYSRQPETDTTSASDVHLQTQTSSPNQFTVPDTDSEYESDGHSPASDANGPSSAVTTPEQIKMKPGSQQRPIEFDDSESESLTEPVVQDPSKPTEAQSPPNSPILASINTCNDWPAWEGEHDEFADGQDLDQPMLSSDASEAGTTSDLEDMEDSESESDEESAVSPDDGEDMERGEPGDIPYSDITCLERDPFDVSSEESTADGASACVPESRYDPVRNIARVEIPRVLPTLSFEPLANFQGLSPCTSAWPLPTANPLPQQSQAGNADLSGDTTVRNLSSKNATAKGKMSISELLGPIEESAVQSSPSVDPTLTGTATVTSGGQKRKRHDCEADDEEEPAAKKAATTDAATSPHDARIHHQPGVIRRVAQGAAKVGLGAVIGVAGTVAFLNSDLALQLVQYLD